LGLPAVAGESVSFGLWESRDTPAADRHWFTEINVCKNYSRQARPPKGAAFLSALRQYLMAMRQQVVYLLLGHQNGAQEGWLVTDSAEECLGPAVTWHSHTSCGMTWDGQFHLMQNQLRQPAAVPFVDSEMRPEMRPVKTGLGATFEPIPQPAGGFLLKITNCGGARFLFGPMFWAEENRPRSALSPFFAHLFGWANNPPQFVQTRGVHRLRGLGGHSPGQPCPPGRLVFFLPAGSQSPVQAPHRSGCVCQTHDYANRAGLHVHQPWEPLEGQAWMSEFLHL